MECDAARDLMLDAVDHKMPPDLASHMRGCPDCARRWSRLKALDARLRSLSLADPPAGLSHRVMDRIADEASPPRGYVHELVLALMLVLTGVAFAGALLAAQLQGNLPALLARQAAVAAHGAGIILSAVPQVGADGWPVLVQLAFAVAVALAWFGAVIMPRRPAAATFHGTRASGVRHAATHHDADAESGRRGGAR